MSKGKGDLGKALVGLVEAGVRRVRGKKPTKQIVREVTDAVRGVTKRTPTPSRRQAAAVRRRPTTPESAERFYLRPETPVAPRRSLPSATSPRVRTQAVSRTDRGTVARAGEAAARQADEAAGAVKRFPRLRKYGTRTAVAGGLVGGATAAIGLLGRDGGGEGYEFIPEDFVAGVPGAGVLPPGSEATPDEFAAYEEILRQKALAETGQFDPFATDAMGEGGLGMEGGMGLGGEEDIYGNLRTGFGNWAGNLRGYGTAKGSGIRSTYGGLSEQALKDAAEAEAIARAASGDIGRIGRDYSAAATQDIQSPGAGGPTELTGLTPVTGESYDIPGRIADTSQIAADYVLRDLNLTRDDLNFMSGMAQQMGPAYEAQLNENLAMLIADKQFELEQSIFSQQAEDRRAAEANRQQAISDFYNGQLALELMRAKQAPKATRPVSAEQIQAGIQNMTFDQMQLLMSSFNTLMKDEKGKKALRSLGVNPDDPNAFNAYLAQEVRAQLAAAGE